MESRVKCKIHPISVRYKKINYYRWYLSIDYKKFVQIHYKFRIFNFFLGKFYFISIKSEWVYILAPIINFYNCGRRQPISISIPILILISIDIYINLHIHIFTYINILNTDLILQFILFCFVEVVKVYSKVRN